MKRGSFILLLVMVVGLMKTGVVFSDFSDRSKMVAAVKEAFKDDSDSAEKLIELIAKHGVDVIDKKGENFLHIAVQEGNEDVLDLLFGERTVNGNGNGREISEWGIVGSWMVNKQNVLGRTPLHYAAESGKTRLAKLLLKEKANINVIDKTGKSPLMLAVDNERPGMIKFLLKNGANAQQADFNGYMPIHYVAFREKEKLFNELLKGGADINAQTKKPEQKDRVFGRTPLHIVIKANKPDFAEFILSKKGIDLYKKDTEGNTVVHYAAAYGDYPFVLKLLKYVMRKDKQLLSLDEKNNKGETPKVVARKNQDKQVETLFGMKKKKSRAYLKNNKGKKGKKRKKNKKSRKTWFGK